MRKLFLCSIFIYLLVPAVSNAQPVKGTGHLTIYNYHLGELLDVTYRNKGKYDKKALEEINHVFRSRLDEKEFAIDVNLIELLSNIQGHFKADSLELISGYRSPSLNRKLKENSINVAEESLHLDGKAADIHIDEVTELAVANYVRSLKTGGVGYYPALDFVHVDIGDVRNWNLPDRPGRLLMSFDKGAIWQILTDRDIYLPEESVFYEVMNITRVTKVFDKKIILELYRRGKWQTVRELNIEEDKRKLIAGGIVEFEWKPSKDDLHGKYRIVIQGAGAQSNEFYLKME